MPNLVGKKINSILISWEKCWMKEKCNRVKLQPSAPHWPRMCDYVIHGFLLRRASQPDPWLGLWQGCRKFPSGQKTPLGCLEMHSCIKYPDLPQLSRFTSAPFHLKFGLCAPNYALKSSLCPSKLLTCLFHSSWSFNRFPAKVFGLPAPRSKMATLHDDKRAPRLSRWILDSHCLGSKPGSASS